MGPGADALSDSFTCPICGMTSHHPQDVENEYCGNCHVMIGPLRDYWRWLYGDAEPDWGWLLAMQRQAERALG